MLKYSALVTCIRLPGIKCRAGGIIQAMDYENVGLVPS